MTKRACFKRALFIFTPMKKIPGILLLIGCTFLASAQSPDDQYTKWSDQYYNFLQNQQYDSLAAHFDSTVARYMNAEKLEQTWTSMTDKFGAIKNNELRSSEIKEKFTVTQRMLEMEKGKFILTLTLDPKGRIAGIFISPANNQYMPPSYVNTLNFFEFKLEFGDKEFPLSGTLAIPKTTGKHPLVIIVHGSGPMDRDATLGPNKIYKDFAWALAARGIATFRYDKRTYAYPVIVADKMAREKNYTAKDEVTEDVIAAVKKLKVDERIDASRIFILGHSMGGMMAPLIMKECSDIKGAIMAAANARPMQELMIEQLNYLYGDMYLPIEHRANVNNLIAQAQYSLRKDLKPDAPLDSLPSGINAPYWIFLNNYNQVAMAEKIKKPMLFLQGERDYQVTMTDLRIWKERLENKGDYTFYTYPKLNHMFMEGEGKPDRKEYEKQGNVPEYVIDNITDWIGKH